MPYYKQHEPVSSRDFMRYMQKGEVAHTALEDCRMARDAYYHAMSILA
jgi:hypothetical protein